MYGANSALLIKLFHHITPLPTVWESCLALINSTGEKYKHECTQAEIQ